MPVDLLPETSENLQQLSPADPVSLRALLPEHLRTYAAFRAHMLNGESDIYLELEGRQMRKDLASWDQEAND